MCSFLLCCWKRMFAVTSVFSLQTLLVFALLHSVFQGQICLFLQVIVPIQGLNLYLQQLMHWQADSLKLSHQGRPKKMHRSEQTPVSNNTREDSTHGHHHMVNTKIRLLVFFAGKDGEALYS